MARVVALRSVWWWTPRSVAPENWIFIQYRTAARSHRGACLPREATRLSGQQQQQQQQQLELIEGAANTAPAPVHDMGVDHRRGHIAVAEQFLHRADVVARLQQVRGKGVAQNMG